MKKREMRAEINRLENTIGYLSVRLEEQWQDIEYWQDAYIAQLRETKKWASAAVEYIERCIRAETRE